MAPAIMLLRIVIRINIVRCISVNKIEITVLSARVLDALSGRGLKAKTVHEFERYGTRRIVKHCLGKGQILYLRSYLKKFHPADNRKRDDYVFYAYGGPQRAMSPDTVAAFVKKYGESARHVCTSIPERVHPHMLRHTRAMHLYQDGVPLAMVSEFLGHAQIETTKIYAHADTEMKRKAIQQAANKLNDTIPDALWNTDDEEMMLKLRGKQQYK